MSLGILINLVYYFRQTWTIYRKTFFTRKKSEILHHVDIVRTAPARKNGKGSRFVVIEFRPQFEIGLRKRLGDSVQCARTMATVV